MSKIPQDMVDAYKHLSNNQRKRIMKAFCNKKKSKYTRKKKK